MHFKIIMSPELALVQKEGIPKRIIRRALNRTGRSARAMVSREVRKIYNIRKKDFDKHLSFIPARNNEIAALHIKGQRLPLYYFVSPASIRQFEKNPAGWTTRKTRKGGYKKARKPYVKVKVKKTEGWKWLKRNAFIAQMNSGHRGVFRRMSNWEHKWVPQKNRYHGLPIAELTTVSAVQMAENVHVLKKIDEFVREKLTKELLHEIEFQLGVNYQKLTEEKRQDAGSTDP